jgi:hypothetical protein
MEHNNFSYAKRTKIFGIMIFVMVILLLPMVIAADFDNSKSTKAIKKGESYSLDKKIIKYNPLWEKYKPIEINNWFGVGEKLFAGAIVNHTESCGIDCFSIMDVYLTNKGVLIDDIRFYTVDGEKRTEQAIRGYQIYIKDKKDEWIFYKIGTEVDAGTYEVKLEGQKRPDRTVDWQIKTSGVWTTDWAVWGATYLVIYDDFSTGVGFSTRWTNITQRTGGITINTEQVVGGKYERDINLQPADAANINTSISSNNLPDYKYIQNITIQFSDKNYFNSYDKVYLFGQLIHSGIGSALPDTYYYNFTLVKNLSQFDYYKNGTYIITFTPTNNIFQINSSGASSGATVAWGYDIYDVSYYRTNETIELNSPANNFLSPTNSVNFNCSASVFGGATITNMSLWTNSTGSWAINQTKTYARGIYDVYDNVINTSLWSVAGHPYTPVENTEKLSASIVALCSGDCGTYTSWFNSTNFRTLDEILNMSFRAKIELATDGGAAYGSQSGYVKVFGTNIMTTIDDSNWSIIKNNTCSNCFDVFNDGIYSQTIVGTNNQIFGYAQISAGSSGTRGTAITSIYKIYFNLTSNTTSIFNTSLYQPTLWTCQACDSDETCGFASENRTVLFDIIPPNITIHNPATLVDYGYIGKNETLNWTIVDDNLISAWYNYNGTNTTVYGLINSTLFKTTTQKNLTFYTLDGAGNTANQFISWNYRIFQNNQTYSNPAYETNSETFSINVTANVSSSLTAASLIYNGVSYPASTSGTTPSAVWSRTIDIPAVTSPTNRPFNWSFTYAGNQIISQANISDNPYNQTQLVNPINFVACNGTYIVPFINYTYRDEMTNFPINASTISSSFNYWMGSGTVKKQYYYINLSEVPSAPFCFSPPDKTMKTNFIYQAGSTGYITRTFSSTTDYTLTNSTTQKLYYLILATDSGSVTITVVDLTSANVVSNADVVITRDIAGSIVPIFEGQTDDAGTVETSLSSIVDYTITASKSGCGITTKTVRPVGPYTIQLNCATNVTEYVSLIDGVTYQRTPATGISNIPGNTTFGYYVSSLYYPIVAARFELHEASGGLLASNETNVSSGYTWCNSTGCLLTMQYYTVGGDNIKGRYYVKIANGTNSSTNNWILLEKDAYWRYIFINTNNSQQAWQKTTLHFNEFMNVWLGGTAQTNCIIYRTEINCLAVPVCKWQNTSTWDPATFPVSLDSGVCLLKDEINKQEFNRILIIFFGLVIALFIIGRGTGYEMTNPGSFVLLLSTVIIMLSASGQFTFAGLTPWDWFNQYIYAYICMTFSLGYNLSIIRRYSS